MIPAPLSAVLALNNLNARELSWLVRQPELYEDLLQHAQRAGFDLVVCEVNCVPSNPGSDAFHAALGFVEVGRADLIGRNEVVRYLARQFQRAGFFANPS